MASARGKGKRKWSWGLRGKARPAGLGPARLPSPPPPGGVVSGKELIRRSTGGPWFSDSGRQFVGGQTDPEHAGAEMSGGGGIEKQWRFPSEFTGLSVTDEPKTTTRDTFPVATARR